MYLIGIQIPEAFDQGLVIALVGYSIVFSALVLLYFFFNNVSKLLNTNLRNRLRREGKHEIAELPDMTGEETAAIAMALYLYNEVHDEESNIITIKKVNKTYSPWSSKIYGVRNFRR